MIIREWVIDRLLTYCLCAPSLGVACIVVVQTVFFLLTVPVFISIIPLRRNFYPLRNYILWRSIEISFAAYVVCRSLISSLRRKIYLSKTISLPSLRYYQGLTPKRTVASLLSFTKAPWSMSQDAVMNLFPHLLLLMKKSPYGIGTFLIKTIFMRALK